MRIFSIFSSWPLDYHYFIMTLPWNIQEFSTFFPLNPWKSSFFLDFWHTPWKRISSTGGRSFWKKKPNLMFKDDMHLNNLLTNFFKSYFWFKIFSFLRHDINNILFLYFIAWTAISRLKRAKPKGLSVELFFKELECNNFCLCTFSFAS